MLIGMAAVRFFKFPRWVTPAVMFNNSTSLPLLLVQSMESTGILDDILKPGESSHEAIARAQSYFLVNAVISNCATFAVGPLLLNGRKRRVYDELDGNVSSDEEDTLDGEAEEIREEIRQEIREEIREEIRQEANGQRPTTTRLDTTEAGETTSLLPKRLNALEARLTKHAYERTHSFLHKAHLHPDDLSHGTRSFFTIMFSFINAPLLGALVGFVLGIVPRLHRWFFADSHNGGIFTAWLTQSLSNTGDLFVTLQVVIVGVTLSSSLRKMKRGESGEASGQITWSSMTFVFVIRYIFWPLVGIPIIYGLARRNILDNDPVLWFCMCLMPCGPPAMKLVPMADVSGTDEGVKMTVAKLLTVMYGLSPLLSFVVVAALKVSQKALEG